MLREILLFHFLSFEPYGPSDRVIDVCVCNLGSKETHSLKNNWEKFQIMLNITNTLNVQNQHSFYSKSYLLFEYYTEIIGFQICIKKSGNQF